MSKIKLKSLTSSDVEFFMEWGGDPEVTRSLFWDHYTDHDSARAFLKNVAESHPWFKGIWVNDTVVGAITLDQGKMRASKRAELGYVIAKKYWNCGYATKAVGLALKTGFSDLGISRIEALVDPGNLASILVLEKNKFTLEGKLAKYVIHRGIIRDRFIYSFTV